MIRVLATALAIVVELIRSIVFGFIDKEPPKAVSQGWLMGPLITGVFFCIKTYNNSK